MGLLYLWFHAILLRLRGRLPLFLKPISWLEAQSEIF